MKRAYIYSAHCRFYSGDCRTIKSHNSYLSSQQRILEYLLLLYEYNGQIVRAIHYTLSKLKSR